MVVKYGPNAIFTRMLTDLHLLIPKTHLLNLKITSSVYIYILNLFPAPASVEALQMSPSTTHIEVSWELSSSLCSADYYIMRYSLYQKLACSSPETTPTEFELNTNVTQYNNLTGLEPYSRYQITVTAVNGAGQSEPTIGYSNTSPGRE